MQCGLLRFLCSLVMYCMGTEADGLFLNLFKMHFQDYLEQRWIAMPWTRPLSDLPSVAES